MVWSSQSPFADIRHFSAHITNKLHAHHDQPPRFFRTCPSATWCLEVWKTEQLLTNCQTYQKVIFFLNRILRKKSRENSIGNSTILRLPGLTSINRQEDFGRNVEKEGLTKWRFSRESWRMPPKRNHPPKCSPWKTKEECITVDQLRMYTHVDLSHALASKHKLRRHAHTCTFSAVNVEKCDDPRITPNCYDYVAQQKATARTQRQNPRTNAYMYKL